MLHSLRRRRRSAVLGTTLLLASSVLHSAQSVWVVDDDGGPDVDFTDIQPAVLASAAGDVILVRSGIYGPVTIGRSKTVQADDGAVVRLHDPSLPLGGFPLLTIQNLDVGEEVYVRGLIVGASYFHPFGVPQEALRVTNSAGEVWLEDVHVEKVIHAVAQGIVVRDSAGVTFSRCSVTSDFSFQKFSTVYGPGLESFASNVALFDTRIQAGIGGRQTPGADGVVVHGGTLYASGCQVLGGDGYDGTSFDPEGTDGGDGLVLDDGAVVRLQDCTVAGGSGGVAGPGGSSGVPGANTVVSDGSLVPVQGTSRSLVEASPVRAGTDAFVETLRGQPGDLAYRLYSTDGQLAPLYIAFEKAPLVLDLNLFGDVLGPVDPDGTLVQTAPSAPMPAGVDGAVITTQASFLAADGTGFYFSAPSAITLVASSL